ncbi:MAG: serine/threonine protein kinase [Acidobacteriota bacterium]|nr:serine/threonine protein kinase [Acidobacteriota bacterium]
MADALGQFRLLEQIGSGGLGDVYRARDTKVGRTVAVKVVPSSIADDPDARAQLIADAQQAAKISHPNVATLFEVVDEPEGLSLAMEYVPGETLRQAIGGRPLNPRRAVEIATQIADALAEAHAAGVRHLDLSPDTIVLTPRGPAKLLDLGLSAWTRGGRARREAAARLAKGESIELQTAPYLSPEQALGEAVDDRSDLFSLGVVLFEMLTGRVPFGGANPTEQAIGVMQATAPAPSQLNPAVPRELDAIVARTLAKGLDARCETAAELAAELRALSAILDVRASDAAPPTRMRVERRRSPWPAWLGALMLVAVVLWLWWRMGR